MEAAAMFGALLVALFITQQMDDKPLTTIYCNNKQLVTTLNQPDYIELDPLEPDWDLLQAIRKVRQQLRRHHIYWIESHQDSTTPLDDLPWPAKMNVKADELATFYRQHHQEHRALPTPPVPILCHDNIPITAALDRWIRFYADGDRLLSFLTEEHN